MIIRVIEWFLRVLRREKHVIGRSGFPYLTRWVLWGTRYGPGQKVFLHHFHRSDSDTALHDHPWKFWSLILWPGYFEETSRGKRWYGPLSLLRRPAEWKHRVELSPGKECWTLIWTGDKLRHWGFHCPKGWVHWKEFVTREDAGQSGCGV